MLAYGVIFFKMLALGVFLLMYFGKKKLFGANDTYAIENIKQHPFLFAFEIILIGTFTAKLFVDKSLIELGFSKDSLTLISSILILCFSSVNFLRAAILHSEKKN